MRNLDNSQFIELLRMLAEDGGSHGAVFGEAARRLTEAKGEGTRKIVLRDEEYNILQKVLRAVPPANLPRILPDWTGGDMHYYRCLLTKVLHKNYHFPKTDDGMEG